MADAFMGEIKITPFSQPPKGWAFCNGQFMPINQNQALFSLLGTMYGGNGQTTFALPDLRGRIPIHVGSGHIQGEVGGQEAHTLTTSEMPQHLHVVQGSNSQADTKDPSGATWAVNPSGVRLYASPSAPNNATSPLSPAAVTNAGGSQPHQNMPPYLVLNFIICLVGLFPSRN